MEHSGYRILLIEEDPKQTELYSELAREVASSEIDVISRPEDSFDWIARFNYHLVIIDSTSAADSLGLLERIKRLSPTTGVILISNQATVEEAVSAIRLGAEDYFGKPLNLESFQLAMKRALDRKVVFEGSGGAGGYLNLINSCQMISASLEQAKIFWTIQSYFWRELETRHTAIYTLKDGSPVRASEDENGREKDHAMEEILDISLAASNPLIGMSQAGEIFRFTERGSLTPGIFIFRFQCVGDTDYFCVCLSPVKPRDLEAFAGRLRILKAQIQVSGRNIEKYMGVRSLAYMDDATGLYNTRYLHEVIDREVSQYATSNKPFAVLFIDCDRFKGVNDNHGHLVGTKLLNALGMQLRKMVRDSDTVFRYGGDEFIAVLSPCDLQTAKTVAERIRKSVETSAFLAEEGLDLKFTVSIGVALFPEHAASKLEIIDAADKAMYSAKKTERNKVSIAGIPGLKREIVEAVVVDKTEVAKKASGSSRKSRGRK